MVGCNEAMSRFFSPRFTLLLGLYLLVPFAIKTLTGLPVWPAILFPVGSGKLYVANGKVAFGHLSFQGFDREGNRRELDRAELFAPIPIGYSGGMADAELGLSEATTRLVWVRGLRRQISIARRVPDLALRSEVAGWWSARLQDRGLSPDRIVIRRDEMIVEVKSGREVGRRLIDERTIALR